MAITKQSILENSKSRKGKRKQKKTTWKTKDGNEKKKKTKTNEDVLIDRGDCNYRMDLATQSISYHTFVISAICLSFIWLQMNIVMRYLFSTQSVTENAGIADEQPERRDETKNKNSVMLTLMWKEFVSLRIQKQKQENSRKKKT